MRVATVYNAGKHSKVGPAKNIARLYSNSELFASKGVELVGPFVPDQGIADVSAYEKTTNFKLKSLVKRVLRSCGVGNLVLLRLTQIRLSRMALKEYLDFDGDSADLVVFRDVISAHEYIRMGGTRPFVLVMHNDGTLDMFFSASSFAKLGYGLPRRLLDGWFEEVFLRASGLLFLSPDARNRFRERYPDIDCVTGIYHQGLDKPETIAPLENVPADSVVFVSIGTVSERKNQRGIIRAFSGLDDARAVLVVVGVGEDLPYCQKLAKDLGVDDRVIFTGSLDNVGNALTVADVFVSASFDEGVPNAAVEAMAYGLPLILTDVGSCKMLLDNENGILIPTDDRQLLKAMSQMAEDKDKRNQCGENSYALYARSYRVETMCLEHCEMYLRTLAAASGESTCE